MLSEVGRQTFDSSYSNSSERATRLGAGWATTDRESHPCHHVERGKRFYVVGSRHFPFRSLRFFPMGKSNFLAAKRSTIRGLVRQEAKARMKLAALAKAGKLRFEEVSLAAAYGVNAATTPLDVERLRRFCRHLSYRPTTWNE